MITPGGHQDGHSVLLARRHRYTGTLSFYRCWTPGPVPLSRLIAIAVTRWRVDIPWILIGGSCISGREAIGRSRDGLTTKIHLASDLRCRPVARRSHRLHGPNSALVPGELRPAGAAGPPRRGRCAYVSVLTCSCNGQLVLMAVSSTTKEVCSEESSVPVNFRVTVLPAKLPSE
jgi:hypothetical protein